MIAQAAGKILSFTFAITMLGMLGGCSTQALDRTASPPPVNPVGSAKSSAATIGEKAAAVALQQVGVPYRYGGSSTNGFDCSGLVQYSYQEAGKQVARTTGQLWSSTKTVPRSEIKVGDLLFFEIAGKMSHVGMYVGGQQFVHAPSTGRTVTVASLDSPFYSAALLRAGRPQ